MIDKFVSLTYTFFDSCDIHDCTQLPV